MALTRRRSEAAREAFAPTANLMAMYQSAHGIKCQPSDFMPKAKQKPSREDGPGLEVFEKWMRAAKNGKA